MSDDDITDADIDAELDAAGWPDAILDVDGNPVDYASLEDIIGTEAPPAD